VSRMLVDEVAQHARVHDVKIDDEIVPVLDEREVHVRHPVDEHEHDAEACAHTHHEADEERQSDQQVPPGHQEGRDWGDTRCREHREQIMERLCVAQESGTIKRDEMSEGLRNSTGSIATVCEITKHAAEIDRLIVGNKPTAVVATDETIEDATVFALEEHLEEFLVENWGTTSLGQKYNIFAEGGEPVGQQYPTDTGAIDILAVKKDGKELLVVELKKGRASDVVVGQGISQLPSCGCGGLG
jgi:hypothetical protein